MILYWEAKELPKHPPSFLSVGRCSDSEGSRPMAHDPGVKRASHVARATPTPIKMMNARLSPLTGVGGAQPGVTFEVKIVQKFLSSVCFRPLDLVIAPIKNTPLERGIKHKPDFSIQKDGLGHD
jgi:hypothetical protein